jgi:2-hydroxymuconate-semialdehyde hydrolase
MRGEGGAPRARGRLAPEAMFPAGVPEVRVRRTIIPGGLGLRVAESGDPHAPPVLLVHGWGASIYMWRAWFAPLAAAGFRPIAVDLPGHGLSDKPDEPGAYTLERQVELLRAFVAVERLEGAPVVAQSMGASISLELALSDPSALGPLALVNPSLFGRVGLVTVGRVVSPTFVDRALARLVPRWLVAVIHRRVYSHPSRITSRDIDEYWAPSQLPGYARALWQLLHEFRWEPPPVTVMAERLGRLSWPPIVMLGGRDALVRGSRTYAAALKRAGAVIELHELPDGGHAMNEEEPEVVMRRVLERLTRDAADKGERETGRKVR